VKEAKAKGGGLKWAKLQASDWHLLLIEMLDAALLSDVELVKCGFDYSVGILDDGSYSFLDDVANFDIFEDHVRLALSAQGEFREMGVMYRTWPWVSCLLVGDPVGGDICT